MAATDTLDITVTHHQLAAIAEEMGAALIRTAYSPNIKERQDLSCAVFDRAGRMVAQAAHIPVHLGAMPLAVQAAREAAANDRWRPGDVVILNDPYLGGTHLPDVTMVSPVFTAASGDRRSRTRIGFVASRAHQADIGGMSPGSMPLARELFQEGLIIPPIKWVRAGRVQEDILALILRNVRTPDERRGDLFAQRAAHRVGERRYVALAEAIGPEALGQRQDALLDYGEQLCRATLRRIPAGTYSAEDVLDDDGVGDEPVPIRVTIVARDGELRVDFAGSADEVLGSVNAVRAVTVSAVSYVVRCLVGSDGGSERQNQPSTGGAAAASPLPLNAGTMRPVTVITPEGSVVSARWPHAVSAGNVETAQRIVDVVLAAFAPALPGLIPASSYGTMNNTIIGGYDPERQRSFTYYETIGGGHGGAPQGPGLSGAQAHMTNTLNTPAEALEYAYPLQVRAYRLREGSGGAGRHRGGDGLVREVVLDVPATITLLSERRQRGAPGLAGGAAGKPGVNAVHRAAGAVERLPGKCERHLAAGDLLVVETPGGGGWGTPPASGEEPVAGD